MISLWITGLALWVISSLVGTRFERIASYLTFAGGMLVSFAGLMFLANGRNFEWFSRFPLGGQFIHIWIDGVNAWFLVLVGAIGAIGAIYASEYWSHKLKPDSSRRGRWWWNSTLIMMVALLVMRNGLHFLIAWELFALCAYFLVTLDRDQLETRQAGWLYLAASHAGTLGLFLFFSLLAMKTGSWELGPMTENKELAPLFWIVLFGFGVKAGLFGLHFWLPSAHANAPSHVSALMSAVSIKMGIYGIIRFSSWLPLPENAGWIVIVIGVVTALLGVLFCVVQNDMKRLLAYCSVENIGVIIIALGLAILGRQSGNTEWGRMAIMGALLHIWNHGVSKSLLFFSTGSILHATGTREMSQMGGLWKSMPWTVTFFVAGAMAITALPPFNGLVSEWLIYVSIFKIGMLHDGAAITALPGAIILGAAGAVALAAFLKAGTVMFLGAPRTETVKHAHECGAMMRASMGLLLITCLFLAVMPSVLWPLLSNAESAWNGNIAQPLTNPFGPLTRANAAIICVLVMGVSFIWLFLLSGKIRRGPTWDCGYANPTSRMQYSSGSFSQTIGHWFRLFLRPESVSQKPESFFPKHADREIKQPDLILDGLLRPLTNRVMMISERVRRLQHGRLPDYILYLVIGLIAVYGITILKG